MRGRKPKPTRLKIVTGNPGKRPLNENEPRPRPGIPSCPSHLCKEGKKEWRRISKLLDEMGLVTQADRARLADLCANWARVVKLEKQVQKEGEVLYDGETGRAYTHPAASVLFKAYKSLASACAEFGLTPSSRSRLQVGGSTEEADPFEELLSGRKKA